MDLFGPAPHELTLYDLTNSLTSKARRAGNFKARRGHSKEKLHRLSGSTYPGAGAHQITQRRIALAHRLTVSSLGNVREHHTLVR